MIYFLQDSSTFEIKIGYTGDTLNSRKSNLQTGNPHGLVVLQTRPGDRSVEAALHAQFDHAHERGDWFRPVPELIKEIVAYAAAERAEKCWADMAQEVVGRLGEYREYVRNDHRGSDGYDVAESQLCHMLDCTPDVLEYLAGGDMPEGMLFHWWSPGGGFYQELGNISPDMLALVD